MAENGKKTVRFDALVGQTGQPVQVTLWTKPEEDRDFMRAVKEKRVVTVIQHNVGTKKDYGLVGFHPQDRATYLIFRKPLGLPDETKIVGKLPLLKEKEPKPKQEPPAPEPPKLFKFQSKVELTANQTATIEVEATSAKEAGTLLKARAEELTIDPAQAKVTRKVATPQKRKG
jgi:hypothetical protein